MFALEQGEKVVATVHKHWFALVTPGLGALFLLLLPSFLITGVYALPFNLNLEVSTPFINFLLSIYTLFILLFLFITWIEYYLDMWIITSSRIIDIEQTGLFNRQVSEIALDRIQDVTVEIRGIIKTLLGFGTIHIQTAGEREFFIDDIPNPSHIKDLVFNKSISPARHPDIPQ